MNIHPIYFVVVFAITCTPLYSSQSASSSHTPLSPLEIPSPTSSSSNLSPLSETEFSPLSQAAQDAHDLATFLELKRTTESNCHEPLHNNSIGELLKKAASIQDPDGRFVAHSAICTAIATSRAIEVANLSSQIQTLHDKVAKIEKAIVEEQIEKLSSEVQKLKEKVAKIEKEKKKEEDDWCTIL